MTQALQARLFFFAEGTGFELHLIGQVLVVKTRLAYDPFCRSAFARGENALQHHGDDAAAAGRAEDHQPVRALDESRTHAGEHALARGNGIGLRSHQSVHIGHAGPGGEVVHLVVEQHAGAGGDEAGAKGVIDAERGRHAIALGIENREMGGVMALRRWRHRRQFPAGRGPGQ